MYFYIRQWVVRGNHNIGSFRRLTQIYTPSGCQFWNYVFYLPTREICLSDEVSVSVARKVCNCLGQKGFFLAPKHMPYAINCLFHTHCHLQNCYKSLGYFFFPPNQFFWDILWILQSGKILREHCCLFPTPCPLFSFLGIIWNDYWSFFRKCFTR